jgi:hypothetical protein
VGFVGLDQKLQLLPDFRFVEYVAPEKEGNAANL